MKQRQPVVFSCMTARRGFRPCTQFTSFLQKQKLLFTEMLWYFPVQVCYHKYSCQSANADKGRMQICGAHDRAVTKNVRI
ncbi:hypothetical protein BRYFOR_08092 [Marvinbryantia formatexigens DSM 14469]|uniref:Uncharacterized protein n=1 Tax=Marvinbryantia formatexigens DSM 14469 TaxID=478749 RepID=C6LHI1_9FIRM|nr:hypothetical protein BRYFOR_08092 [Marvinbryantia formatexigens DSM 14469]